MWTKINYLTVGCPYCRGGVVYILILRRILKFCYISCIWPDVATNKHPSPPPGYIWVQKNWIGAFSCTDFWLGVCIMYLDFLHWCWLFVPLYFCLLCVRSFVLERVSLVLFLFVLSPLTSVCLACMWRECRRLKLCACIIYLIFEVEPQN